MRTASRWTLRAFVPATGAMIALALAAGNADAAGLAVTSTTPASPTTDTPLTWDVTTTDGSPTSCELHYGAATGAVVDPVTDCGPTVTYSVVGQPAGAYTLVAYEATAADVTAGVSAPTASSSVDVAPPAPTPSGPTGPSQDRSPQWALGLPSGTTGACQLTAADGTVVDSADPCASPWTSDLGTAADGVYTLHVTASQGGLTSADSTL